MRHHLMVSLLAATLAVPLAITSPIQAQVTQIDSISAQAAILSAGSRAAEVSHIRQVPSVGVINLAFGHEFPLMGDHDIPSPQEFKLSAEKNAAGGHKLQKALQANPVTRRALQNHGVRAGSVVGVDISSNGSLRLYILR